MFDIPAYLATRVFVGSLNLLPLGARQRICEVLVRLVVFFVPRYRHIAMKNIALVFPQSDAAAHEALFEESIRATARFVVDAVRLHTLDAEWSREHVRYPEAAVAALRARYPGKGLLIATGHLGSFELMGRAVALQGHPLGFVVRNFNLKRLDRWWTDMREEPGNKVIGRSGAFSEIVREIECGRDVAVLFDQNVKRNHAVFVPFFGRLAATTRAVALAALRTRAPLVVASISYEGGDCYTVHAEPCDAEDLYEDESRSSDEKVYELTLRLNRLFEQQLLAAPAEWFWMHRRWKTTPDGTREDFYA